MRDTEIEKTNKKLFRGNQEERQSQRGERERRNNKGRGGKTMGGAGD